MARPRKPIRKLEQPTEGDTRYIPLTQGLVAMVSAGDYEALAGMNWCAARHKSGNIYAMNSSTGRMMHQYLIPTVPSGMVRDHEDGNGLNNQRLNLRVIPKGHNGRNRGPNRNSVIGIKGVTLRPRLKNPYTARLRVDGGLIHLGSYPSIEEAAEAVETASKYYNGPLHRKLEK